MKKIIQLAYRLDGDQIELLNLPVLDCRVLPNPFRRGDTELQILGRLAEMTCTESWHALAEQGVSMLRQYDAIVVACLFGKHRSVAMANQVARASEHPVRVVFRDGTIREYTE